MDINRLGSLAILSDYRQNNQRFVETLERLSTSERASSPERDPLLWGDVQQLRDFASTLAGFSDNLNRGAASVRVALDSMEASRQHLLQLEQKLNEAFAATPGSVERSRSLEDYNKLLVYIDDTAKAPDAGARRLLDDPALYPEAGDVEVRAGEGGFSLLLRSREIHSGATGLNLPVAGQAAPSDLAVNPAAPPIIADLNNASDAEIAVMIRHLEEAKEDLTTKAKALAVDATAIEDAENFNDAFILRNNAQANDINVPDLNASAVLANSLANKNALSISGIAGLKDTYRLALRLLQ